MENVQFVERTATPRTFFDILPADWQGGIVPYWPRYQGAARIFTLESEGEVLGGGIVFSRVSPDTMVYEEKAQHWFDRGYCYIGFLWIAVEHRGGGLGSLWLQKLKEQFPDQPFWLSVEEADLIPFYEHNGFRLMGAVQTGTGEEWILAR